MSHSIHNVLLLDNVDPSAKTILETCGIKATLQKEKLTIEKLINELQSYDGVVVRSATKVNSELIKNCPNLKIIGRAGTGVDNVDIDCATKNGVMVMNTPGGNTLSAAEHTCSLICCLSRNIPAADASMKAGRWDRKAFIGHELYEKTLGIIGLGRIGREAAARMQSFGMKTIGFDPLVSKEEAAKYNIEWMTVDEIWPKADYITVHTPLIPQTRGLLNDASFAKCKKGVRVINCARGGIIDEDALLRALESGQCGGAGLDVYVEEPATNTALVTHPKVVACPHLGASTKEAQSRCGREIAEQIADVSEGKSYFGVLNAPALTQAATEGMPEWISALTCAGMLMRRLLSVNSSKELTVDTSGEILSKARHCVRAALSTGFLKSDASNVNLINAAALLSNLGTEISVNHKSSSDASCTVQAKTEDSSLCFTVSVAGGQPVLRSINGMLFSIPVLLDGNLLFYKGEPKKLVTVIGKLAEQGIAVAAVSTTTIKDNLQWVAVTCVQSVAQTTVCDATTVQF